MAVQRDGRQIFLDPERVHHKILLVFGHTLSTGACIIITAMTSLVMQIHFTVHPLILWQSLNFAYDAQQSLSGDHGRVVGKEHVVQQTCYIKRLSGHL